MAKKQQPEGKKYNYMDTYGDLVTLLLCFFVLLYSMSTVEEVKYNAFVEALSTRFSSAPTNLSFVTSDMEIESGDDFGDEQPTGMEISPDPTLPSDLTQMQQKIEEYLEENDMQAEVQVERSESGATFIRMSDNLLFDGNSAVLREEPRDFLNFLASSFNEVESQILSVQFNGHTASIAGSGVDDWELAADRVGIVATFIENEGGFNRFKIKPTGYGRNYPIADNATSEGRARNRRVDIVILSNESTNMEQQLLEALNVYFPTDTTDFFEGNVSDLPEEFMQENEPLAGLDDAAVSVGGATGGPDDAGVAGAGEPAAGGDAPAFAGQ